MSTFSPRAPSPRKLLAFSGVGVALAVFGLPGALLAQEDNSIAETLADDSPAPPEDASESPETETEGEEGPDEGSSDAAPDEVEPEETTDDSPPAAPESKATPPEEELDIQEPLPDAPPTDEDEPDYYGRDDPFSPSYQLSEVPKKPPYDGPFRAGRIRLGISVGGGSYGDQTYFIPGASVGYFVVNGLEVHVDTDFWLIGDPFLATPSLGLRYVLWMIPKVHPYFGAFYRHYFVGSGFDDADSVGGRAGVYFMTGRRSYFGIGAAYEHMLQDHLFSETDFIYPEIAFVFAF